MAFEIKESRAFRPVHEKNKQEEMNESLYNSEEYTIQKNRIIISYDSKYSYRYRRIENMYMYEHSHRSIITEI